MALPISLYSGTCQFGPSGSDFMPYVPGSYLGHTTNKPVDYRGVSTFFHSPSDIPHIRKGPLPVESLLSYV
jgi:hypothetical protein